MTDIAVAIILPRILEICRSEAPLVSFRAIQLPTDSELRALREGAADLAIGFSPALRSGLLHASLFRSEYVCITRSGHPRIHQRLTRRDFLREQHAVALAQGTGHFIVEAMLQRLGLMNQVGARVSNFLALPMIVASSELIATIPRPLAELMQPLAPVVLHPVPVRMPPLNIDVFWHERLHDDPGTRWLRSLLPRAMQTIFSTGPGGFSAAMADEGVQRGKRRAGSTRAGPAVSAEQVFRLIGAAKLGQEPIQSGGPGDSSIGRLSAVCSRHF